MVRYLLVVFLFLAMLLLGGCGAASAAAPLTLDTLPLSPELTLYEGAYEVPLDSMVFATRLAYQVQPEQSEWNYYQLPSYESWEITTAFYEEALASGDWQAEQTASDSTRRWTRQSSAGRQTFVITLLPMPAEPEPSYLVMLMLVSEG